MARELRVSIRSGGVQAVRAWPLSTESRIGSPEPWTIGGLGAPTSVAISDATGGPGSWLFRLDAAGPWASDVTAVAEIDLPGPAPLERVLWPRFSGRFEGERLSSGQAKGVFRGPGRPAPDLLDEDRLALPFAIVEGDGQALLVGTDPAFSATLEVRESGAGVIATIAWTWLAGAGRHAEERRKIFVQTVPNLMAALDRWFELATPEIPAGPAWLHDIALQDYDYLSKNGQGWFADVAAAAELISPSQRHRALFCLHGWYDRIGRYCFDPFTRRLDESWVAFPHVNHPDVLAKGTTTPVLPSIPTPAAYSFRNLGSYRPVSLTWDDLRARLRYARERGFRTCFYLATGLQATGDKDAAVAAGTGLDLPFGLWIGPDLVGPTHLRNPLHADVRSWMLEYLDALLERLGDLVDALVLDEAYYVGFGTLGPPACPGYADRAQATLIRDIATRCHRFRSDLAFLTADNLGVSFLEQRAFPYCVFADGIYQDSWCWPQTWDGVRFPAWRNVAWSCNWAPVTNLAFTRYGVLNHDAPVAISNGCFGDDTGLAEMPPDVLRQIADLWRARTRRERTKALVVVDTLDRDSRDAETRASR
jgi:hypothetical protein